jgi:hypothetical protein
MQTINFCFCYYRLFLSIFFDTTFDRGLKVRHNEHMVLPTWNAVMELTQLAQQPSATSPLLLDNLHFEHFMLPKRRFWKD